MSHFRTGDPIADFDSRDAEEAKWLESLPNCDICGKPIQDKHLYLINDEFVCQDCLERDFRKWTDDYVG